MRSLLTLALSFTLLASYLEAIVQSSPVNMQDIAGSKVIRDVTAPLSPIQSVSYPQQQQRPLRPSLNLRIPDLVRFESHQLNNQASSFDLFNAKPKSSISYNAELVFDADKGESITGGKINIRIPLS